MFDETIAKRAYIDELRKRTGELGNHALDEFVAQRLSRRDLLRIGSCLGFGGAIALLQSTMQCAHAQDKPNTGAIGPQATTLHIANMMPSGAIDPVTIVDGASVALLNQCGEYLVNDLGHQILSPALATSWSANAKCDVWTFRLRENVTFHDGQVMSARDVVATFKRLVDPSVGSAASGSFRGVLSKEGIRAVNASTVAFHLDAPNASFPYLVSSDAYNAIILPESYRGDFEKHFTGTGPFRIEKFEPRFGASFVRNDHYWGGPAVPARLEFRFHEDGSARILAARSGLADIIPNIPVQAANDLSRAGDFRIQSSPASTHHQMHMKTDSGPFKDKRVRQALALSLDRESIVRGLLRGHAELGNDSPFAPMFSVTDRAVPQRAQNLTLARKLLAEAGFQNGFSTVLTTERFKEIPDYAVLVQNAARAIAIDLSLKIESQEMYYGASTRGRSDWLDSTLGITDYGHRGIPNVLVGPTLTTNGEWNASRFNNAEYDKLYKEYKEAIAVGDQQRIAGRMQRVLLEETPVIVSYFFDSLVAVSSRVQNVSFNPTGQLYLDKTHRL